MSNRAGTPIWYDLMTPDIGAAQAFYGAVMGWSCTPVTGEPGRDYRVFVTAEGHGVAGVMPFHGQGPVWGFMSRSMMSMPQRRA